MESHMKMDDHNHGGKNGENRITRIEKFLRHRGFEVQVRIGTKPDRESEGEDDDRSLSLINNGSCHIYALRK